MDKKKNTSVDQKSTNKNKSKKQKKDPRKVANVFCTVTLVLQILLTLCLGGFALAPEVSAFFLASAFAIFTVGIIVTTAASCGIAWMNEGFRNFWANFWNLIVKAFNDPKVIKETLKPNILWIMLPLFIASFCGFICNLIYFIKYDHKNKGRFITSCVFSGIAVFNLIAGLIIYFK